MPDDGNGTFTLVYNWTNDANNGINIRSDRMDGQEEDIAQGLTNRICKDGQTIPTANLPMGGFRHTGASDGVLVSDYATLGQLQNAGVTWCGTAGGTANAITITASPVPSGFVTGQSFEFKASATNTGGVTVSVNGATAKNLYKGGTIPLTAGEIQNGAIVRLTYDGTNYQMPNMQGTNVIRNYSAQQNFGTATLTDAASITWDLNTQQTAKVTLGGNRTLANPSNMVDGGTYILRVIQDGTGSRTLAYGSAYKWPSGIAPLLSTTAASVDILTFVSDGTNMYGVSQKGFA